MIITFTPNPRARLRLFCFPYAGGGASVFRTWQQALPTEVEVCAVQLPGREARSQEPPFVRLSDMSRAVTDALLTRLDGRPFAFFGHSMGSHVAFEVARTLRRRGAPQPLHLLASGRHAPQLPAPDPPIHQLPDPEFIDEIRRLNGTPEAVLEHAELMELMLPILRADFAVCETYEYTPEPPLPCPISAFGGTDDTGVPREILDAWREQTSSTFRLQMFPGDHFFIQSHRAQVLQVVALELARHLAGLPGGAYV